MSYFTRSIGVLLSAYTISEFFPVELRMKVFLIIAWFGFLLAIAWFVWECTWSTRIRPDAPPTPPRFVDTEFLDSEIEHTGD